MDATDIQRLIMELQTPKLKKRFLNKVGLKDENGCMKWTAAKTLQGYGRIQISGAKYQATHIAWYLHTGVWIRTDKGECILHTCDTPACCNVQHLWIGTKSENTSDMIRKGRKRVAQGSKNSHAKVNEHQVKSMRRAYISGITIEEIMLQSGLSRSNIWRIISGKTWKHVPGAVDIKTRRPNEV